MAGTQWFHWSVFCTFTIAVSGCNVGYRNITWFYEYKVFENDLTFQQLIEKLRPVQSSITYLRMANCSLISIPADVLTPFKNLELVELLDNRLYNLHERSFYSLQNLRKIHLDYNMIEDIHADAFGDLQNVTIISLSNNRIRTLSKGIFCDMPSLEEINLKFCQIDQLPNQTFSNLTGLELISLSNNRIKKIATDSFWGTANINQIDLANNFLTEIPLELVKKHNNLETLFIENNNISTLPSDFQPFISKLDKFDVTNNPWHCDCKIEWMSHVPNIRGSLRCHSPGDALNATNVTEYYRENLNCLNITEKRIGAFDVGITAKLPIILGVTSFVLVAIMVTALACFTKKICYRQLVFPKIPMTYNLHYYLPEMESENTVSLTNQPNTLKKNDNLCELQKGAVRGRLRLKRLLGEGAFSDVYEAVTSYDDGKTWVKVAVKKHRGRIEGCLEQLIEEFKLLHDVGSHPNVISVHSCTVIAETFLIIMELADNGDLHTFLRNYEQENRKLIQSQEGTGDKVFLLEHEPRLFCFAWQVAKGLEFLSNLKVIHRDIAARNILLTTHNVAKISDFGLSVDVYQSGYYSQESKGRLPLKWMGPEAVTTGRFTLQSDVWSYGILLWEIFSLGAAPYPRVDPRLLDNLHRSGYVMTQPALCPDTMYTLMRQCWEYVPTMRPSFTYIVESVYTFIQNSINTDYVVFDGNSGKIGEEDEEQQLIPNMIHTVTKD